MSVVSRIPGAANPFADRKRWTADDCRRFEAMAVLEPGTYKLLDGEVVRTSGHTVAHSRACRRTLFALSLVFGADYTVLPVSVAIGDEDRSEPDVLVTSRPDTDFMGRGNPSPAELRLIVEVSDTTLWRDRITKVRLYGGAGVPEYCVLDLNQRRLYVHRQPTADGYADVTEFGEGDHIAPLSAPDSAIAVADLLP